MPGNPIKIGPFLGGLNNMSTAGEARDNELTELVNFEVAKDQSLTMRPPISVEPGSKFYHAAGNNPVGWDLLGIYRVTEAEWYLVAAVPTTVDGQVIRAYPNGDLTSTAFLTIKSITGLNNRVTGMTQFRNELYFTVHPSSSGKCFKWTKSMTTPTDIDKMPKGYILFSWKSRLWVAGTGNAATGDRVWFSKVGAEGPEPSTWEATDFFDVAPGEGGYITAMVPSFNNLIVFKNDGTWRFSYPSSPKQGQIDKISGQVGAAGVNAVVEFENYIYVYDQGSVYELINSNYSKLNQFIKFEEDPFAVDGLAPGIDLSIVNRRLIIRYFTAIYAFNIDTKAWSLWRTENGIPGKFIELPVDSNRSAGSVYLAGSRGQIQNPTQNLILDPKAAGPQELTSSGYIYYDFGQGEGTYQIPMTPNYRYEIQANVVSKTKDVWLRVEFQKADGTTSVGSFAFPNLGMNKVEIQFPDIIYARVALAINPAAVVTDLALVRKALPSPSTVMRVWDSYPDQPNPIEYITAIMKTKAYDYQAAASFKRMFYWGADLVTPRPIHAEARPIGRKNTLTWADLEKYTHSELEQGTWENPLSFKSRSTNEVSMTDGNVHVS